MKVYLLLWICAACDGAAGRRQTYQKVRAHHEHERHLEATTAAPTKAPTKWEAPCVTMNMAMKGIWCCKNKWNRVIDCPESCTDTIFNVENSTLSEGGCYIDDKPAICKNKNGEVITCPASCTDGKRTYGIDRGAGNAFSPKFTVESETDGKISTLSSASAFLHLRWSL